VAILDSGVDATHEDLAFNIDKSLSYSWIDNASALTDLNGHGTCVAGTIVAIGNNKLGIPGITWNVKAIALKILRSDGVSITSINLNAIEYLLDLMNNDKTPVAVNVSFGWNSNFSPEQIKSGESGYILWSAYKALSDTNKIVIVVAAGNEGIEIGKSHKYPGSTREEYVYPASYLDISNMITVAAIDEMDTGAFWGGDSNSPSTKSATNWSSTRVDIAAPGSNIKSIWTGNKYVTERGTSLAAPHVTGAVALLASVSQKFGLSLNASDYKRILLDSASKKIPELILDGKNLGPIARHGTLDLEAAVKQLLKEYVPNYSFTPIDVKWANGQVPAPVAGKTTSVQVMAAQSFKDIRVTLKSPSGTETPLEREVTGTLIKVSFTPSDAGAYVLNFTVTDDYDVDWNAELNFSVERSSNNPDNPEIPGNDGKSGGGGGCSTFSAGLLALIGMAVLVKKNK
jgi:subtilisin family serine protease